MNILVISGGSGNDALIKGLKKFYPESNVKVLVNAYDAGKSTGVCREVTGTLGVSDIRKNHIRMYKATTEHVNQCFVEFYDSRYDFTKGNEAKEVVAKLRAWGLSSLEEYAVRFFKRPEAKNYDYKDFCVSNIVYAEMYAEAGYEATNKFFCNMLGLDDFVILNSFDNIYIKAQTESGKVIEEEGELVEYCNPDDIIVKMIYDLRGPEIGLNPVAVNALYEADLIVVSTGTFWSSIFPTLEYLDFYKYLNDAKAKKIWAINCEPDKDCYGVGSNRMIQFVEDLGVDLSQFTILENSDANEILRQENNEDHVVYEAMGNNRGKHDGDKYARAILKHYYGLKNLDEYDRVLFDFDDTIWARGAANDAALMKFSRDNVELVSELREKAVIISGNSYESISRKLATVYGSNIDKFESDIWADANSALFRKGKRVDVIPELLITGNIRRLGQHLYDAYRIEATVNDFEFPSCVKIKPLSALDQILLSNYLNDYLLAAAGLGFCRALPTGRTTVDIVSRSNNKVAVLSRANIDATKCLYIGDEIDNGNDHDISGVCGCAVHTNGVQETYALLKLLLNK